MNNSKKNNRNPFLFHEIDGAYIVWFENGNQYLYLEEPAFFVFQQLEQGRATEQIVAECVKRYHNTKEESSRFVAEIATGIGSVKQTPVSSMNRDLDFPEIQKKTVEPYSAYSYLTQITR